MSGVLTDRLAEVKAAVIAGNPENAMEKIDRFVATAQRHGVPAGERARLETAMTELLALAEASLRGARQALDEVQAIVLAARSLQTYDSDGRRHVSPTVAPAPRRF